MHGEVEGMLTLICVHGSVYTFLFTRIIAVNYPARDEGVTRHMRGNEAKKKCPSINLVQVPEVRGKADLTKYCCIYIFFSHVCTALF